MGLQLDLSLKQQLKLSPQLIQSLELMTLPLTELQARIQTALESNPTLELPDGNITSIDALPDDDKQRDNDDYASESGSPDSEASDRHQLFMENALAGKETLSDHLLSQFGCIPMDEQIYNTGEILITALDSNGFLPQNPEALLKDNQKRLLPSVLSVIQSLDPIGVGAHDWKESLMIQAKAKHLGEEELTLFHGLVYDNLDLMRSGKIDQVAKALNTDEEEVNALFSFLKTLTPFPGQDYASGPEQFVIPDLSIHQEEGKLVMRLNDSSLPRLTIDPMYEEMEKTMGKSEQEKQTKEYLQSQLKDANLLISQIAMRNQTLDKVGQVLLVEQSEFFLKGPKYLKPLTQRDVADKIGVHETTVSRIATAKWIDTDWGILPLKQLFSNAVGDGGQSKNSVKELVKEIILSNSSGKALSDQKISDLLLEKGVKVARRTVAKYRGELNIVPAFVRGPGEN